ALLLLEAVADARRQLARGADDHHVRHVHGRGAIDDPAGDHLRAAHAAGVADRPPLPGPLPDVQVLDRHLAGAPARFADAARLAAVLAGEHLPRVALFHFQCHLRAPLEPG